MPDHRLGGEQVYNLDVFDAYHIQLTWDDVYYGVKNKLLNLEAVRDYAIRCLEMDDDYCQEVAELAWPNNDMLSVLESIEKILGEKHNLNETLSSMKWQYSIIKYLVNKNIDFEELSNALDEVYADFNYPEDMEEFISYMPIKDDYNPTGHTNEENTERIRKKIDMFLANKYEKLCENMI